MTELLTEQERREIEAKYRDWIFMSSATDEFLGSLRQLIASDRAREKRIKELEEELERHNCKHPPEWVDDQVAYKFCRKCGDGWNA